MRIILGVTGSIASYKALDLCRELSKSGHQVTVILSKGALKFVVPEVFKYLGAKAVYLPQDDFKPSMETISAPVLHVELARENDLLVIAPLSANTLSNLCSGGANDLLSSLFLTWTNRPVILFPAMNTSMLNHPFTKDNLKKIKILEHVFVHPTASGELVCGEVGEGKLPSVELIMDFISSYSLKKNKKKILITTGATIAPLDPFRYLTNASSGITGLEIAKKLLCEGYTVELIAGKNSTPRLEHLQAHPRFNLERVTTSLEMNQAVQKRINQFDCFISSAAVGDIYFDSKKQKIKKDQLNNLTPLKSPDILAQVLNKRKAKQKVIGFAAESPLTPEILDQKYKNKKVDLLIGNVAHHGLNISEAAKGFGTIDGEYWWLEKGQVKEKSVWSKEELAKRISNWIESCW